MEKGVEVVRVQFYYSLNLFVHLECWSEEVKQRKIRKGMWLIWHASIRVIWRARNDKLTFKKLCEGD